MIVRRGGKARGEKNGGSRLSELTIKNASKIRL